MQFPFQWKKHKQWTWSKSSNNLPPQPCTTHRLRVTGAAEPTVQVLTSQGAPGVCALKQTEESETGTGWMPRDNLLNRLRLLISLLCLWKKDISFGKTLFSSFLLNQLRLVLSVTRSGCLGLRPLLGLKHTFLFSLSFSFSPLSLILLDPICPCVCRRY